MRLRSSKRLAVIATSSLICSRFSCAHAALSWSLGRGAADAGVGRDALAFCDVSGSVFWHEDGDG